MTAMASRPAVSTTSPPYDEDEQRDRPDDALFSCTGVPFAGLALIPTDEDRFRDGVFAYCGTIGEGA
jgi:hypothetical protein